MISLSFVMLYLFECFGRCYVDDRFDFVLCFKLLLFPACSLLSFISSLLVCTLDLIRLILMNSLNAVGFHHYYLPHIHCLTLEQNNNNRGGQKSILNKNTFTNTLETDNTTNKIDQYHQTHFRDYPSSPKK